MKTLVITPETMGTPQLEEHKVGIYLDDVPFARPWGCICSCGWRSANTCQREAEESKKAHLAQHEIR